MAMSAYRVAIIDLVSLGQVDEVKKLIAKGCDVNEQGELGQSSVLAAVDRNDLLMLTILIEAGAKLDAKDSFGESALSVAKENGYLEIVSLIEKTLGTSKLTAS